MDFLSNFSKASTAASNAGMAFSKSRVASSAKIFVSFAASTITLIFSVSNNPCHAEKTPSITQLLHNSCMQMTFCRLRVANLNMLLCKTCNQCVRQNLPVQLSQWNIVIKIVIQVNYSLICAMVKIRYDMVIITIYWSFHSHSWFPSAKF